MRRNFLKLTGAAALAAMLGACLPAVPAHAQTKLKFVLDWKYQGIHAWYFHALEKGYFKDEGLEVTIDQGNGSAATISSIMSGAYDAGFGDMNAIIQQAAAKPGEQPVMVYMVYNKAPFAILSKASSGIKTFKDLEGKKLTGATGAATQRLLPLAAKMNGVDPAKIEVVNIAPSLQEQMIIRDQTDGGLVFTVTSYMNLVGMKLDPDKDFQFLNFSDYGIAAYSNGVMVSQKLIKENPKAVAGLVKAINKAMIEVTSNPTLAGEIMAKVEPTINAEIEARRVVYTYRNHIASEEAMKLGAGDVSDERMAKAVSQIAEVYELKTQPKVSDIFNRSFLPPRSERNLAAPKS